ncbi:hypothetical protein [Cloacibacillus sp. An23]|uniref:hypothetical protein n=1 Tax=Cloacibacillus sp. An23 TaxID=1965591 RepID=UPI000B37A449|nr:hypothetical protein [Cloacibacillus sp. An23]OUO95060.1 hypothetical protein B5F39_00555 [Cloacibacillus sp. An23]
MEKNSWHEEIDFHCKFGMWPFQKSLDITPAGFLYCGELFPLKTITRLRWGIDQKRGGIFPKVAYLATFGTATREFTIKTKQKDFYEHLTQRFWRAAGCRLMAEMLEKLKKGGSCVFGDFSISDGGLTVRPKGLFKSQRSEFFEWAKLKWGIVNGNLVFTPSDAPERPIASASFLWVDNAHILSVALALLQERPDKRRLSAIAD